MKEQFTWKKNLIFGILTCLLVYIDGIVYFGYKHTELVKYNSLEFTCNLITFFLWLSGILLLWVYPILIDRKYRSPRMPNKLYFVIALILILLVNRFCLKRIFPHCVLIYTGYLENYAPYGLVTYIMHQVYYLIAAGLVIQIVYFFQEVGEQKFKNTKIPYGAIFLAIFAGIPHFFVNGVEDGIKNIILSLILGIAYILMKKDLRSAYFLALVVFFV